MTARIIAMIIVAVCLASGNLRAQQVTDLPMVTAAALPGMLRQSPIIIDVRMSNERLGVDGQQWRLRCPACLTIDAPFDLDLGFFEDSDRAVVTLHDRPIIIVCRKGIRAHGAALVFQSAGIEVSLLEGGLDTLPDAMITGKRRPQTD